MMPIHVLPDDLAAKIAAGEVIERPASVVKELIENSIDAGATEIKVEILGGGQRLIKVADNGCGIPADQVAVAFARHATSKIESVDDLTRIHTLGFRGEALPSVAAVARVTLITRARGELSGSIIRVDGSSITEQKPQGAPEGTVVSVEELFRHVPARLKFLKTPATEAGHIADLIHAYAFGYPQLRFSLVNDGRLVFFSPGNGLPFDVLVKILGADTAQQMIPVAGSVEPGPTSMTGYVSPPNINRSNRKQMLFFVNHRWVQDRTLQHAVIEAYRTALMVGRAPVVALDVVVPDDMVDVNVHPTKAEVRFRDPSAIFTAVQRTVRPALSRYAPIPTVQTGASWAGQGNARAPDQTQLAIGLHRPWSSPTAPAGGALPPQAQGSNPQKLPMLRVLGQILSTYIIAEGPEGLYLIDQHAAHERVLYEQLMHERQDAEIAVQDLLDPLSLPLSLSQWALLEPNRDALASVGFKLEPFGDHTFLIRSVPAALKKNDPRAALAEILDEIERGEEPLEKGSEARLISSVCKSIAVKGGQALALEEMRELVRRLEQTTSPRTCPHGRPTVIQFNIAQLEREFGRRQ